MFNNFMNTVYGPLDKIYCLWFYYLSIFGFVLFCFAFFIFLYMAVTKRRSSAFYFQMFMVCLGYFVFYFQNRLLHSMCIGVMKN